MSKRKPAAKPARRPQVERPRDKTGRYLSRGQIAAQKGVQTRIKAAKRQQKAAREVAELSKRVAELRAEAAREGARKRRATEAKLTPERKRKRAAKAAAITKAARAKKAPRPAARRRAGSAKKPRRQATTATSTRAARSGRLMTLPTSKKEKKKSTPKFQPSTNAELSFTTGSGDEVAVQIGVKLLNMPRGFDRERITDRVVKQAILHRCTNDDDADRIETKILRWRNPGRRRAEDREWRQGNQGDAWLTLGPMIAAAILAEYPDLAE